MVELINLRNCTDWGREGDIKIDRTTIFGNPFPIGMCTENGDPKFYTRDSCIRRYAEFIYTGEVVTVNGKSYDAEDINKAIDQLAKTPPLRVGCWCRPLPCHGSVIIKLLQREPTRQSTIDKFF